MQLLNNRSSGFVDTALKIHWVHASGNSTQAFRYDGLSQNGCRGGTVTSHVVSLRGHFFNHLGAHVFELVFQFDFFGYRYTVFSDGRSAERLVQYHVAAFRAQGYFNCISKNVNTLHHFGASAITEFDFFSCHDYFLLDSLKFCSFKLGLDRKPDLAFQNTKDFAFGHDQQLFAVDFHCATGILTEYHFVTGFYV